MEFELMMNDGTSLMIDKKTRDYIVGLKSTIPVSFTSIQATRLGSIEEFTINPANIAWLRLAT